MNIAFLIDDNYSEQLCVTVASILKHNRDEFRFFVLNGGISDENKSKLLKLHDMEFIPVDLSVFDEMPTLSHMKTLNYARILVPNLVDCNRILFMDCDLLVQSDLTEFYNLDFEGNYACVVEDRISDTAPIKRQLKNLSIKKYFNAGVMLLNLEKIRSDNIVEKCFRFMQDSQSKILFLDQCVLNYAFSDRVKFVDKKYNYQYKLNFSKKPKDAEIIHFVGKEKPFFGYAHPYEGLYYKYLRLTPYKVGYFEFKNKMWSMFLPKIIKKVQTLLISCDLFPRI